MAWPCGLPPRRPHPGGAQLWHAADRLHAPVATTAGQRAPTLSTSMPLRPLATMSHSHCWPAGARTAWSRWPDRIIDLTRCTSYSCEARRSCVRVCVVAGWVDGVTGAAWGRMQQAGRAASSRRRSARRRKGSRRPAACARGWQRSLSMQPDRGRRCLAACPTRAPAAMHCGAGRQPHIPSRTQPPSPPACPHGCSPAGSPASKPTCPHAPCSRASSQQGVAGARRGQAAGWASRRAADRPQLVGRARPCGAAPLLPARATRAQQEIHAQHAQQGRHERGPRGQLRVHLTSR